eukprot:13948394-Ditylum_brightwellii.AAC.1
MNLQEMCINGPKLRTWATKSMRASDNRQFVASAIREGTAIAISDGLYKDGISMTAASIQGPSYNHRTILGTCVSLGPHEEQDANIGELGGLYFIVATVEQVCIVHNITEGSITVGCDSLE